MEIKNIEEIKSLTGLRGIAALYVIFYHLKGYNFFDGFLKEFFIHGYLAVDIFFVLSGFVMTLTYRHLFEDGFTVAGFRNFMGKRLARIYPLYIAVYLIFLAVYILFPDKFEPISVASFLANILMIQAWGIAPSIVGPSWSISTEFLAYLLFPILISLTYYRSLTISNIIAIFSIMCVFVLSLIPLDIIGHGEKKGLLDIWDGESVGPAIRCVSEFTLGIWACRINNLIRDKKSSTLKYIEGKLFSFLILLLLLLGLSINKADIFIVFLLPFFIISLSSDRTLIASFLKCSPIYYLGTISYSMYLCHPMVFWIKSTILKILATINFPYPEQSTFTLQIIISIILATLTYNIIEKPSRRYFKGLMR